MGEGIVQGHITGVDEGHAVQFIKGRFGAADQIEIVGNDLRLDAHKFTGIDDGIDASVACVGQGDDHFVHAVLLQDFLHFPGRSQNGNAFFFSPGIIVIDISENLITHMGIAVDLIDEGLPEFSRADNDDVLDIDAFFAH